MLLHSDGEGPQLWGLSEAELEDLALTRPEVGELWDVGGEYYYPIHRQTEEDYGDKP